MKEAFGVWGIDTMYIQNGYIAVAVEKVYRKIMAVLIPNLKAETLLEAWKQLFFQVDNIQAIICDRGTENTSFKNLQRMLNIVVYACDPGSLWQKGQVENSIKQLRIYFDRKTDYQALKQKNIFRACTMINNMCRLSLQRETANLSITKLRRWLRGQL